MIAFKFCVDRKSGFYAGQEEEKKKKEEVELVSEKSKNRNLLWKGRDFVLTLWFPLTSRIYSLRGEIRKADYASVHGYLPRTHS